MSRKDLILVAICVNVGVLILLFVSSLKPVSVTEVATLSPTTYVEPPSVLEEKSIDQVVAAICAPESAQKPIAAVETPEDILKPFLAKDLFEVEVKKGDILGKIAMRHKVSVDEIMKLNNLSNSSLRIGQVLYIPKKSPNRPAQNLATSTNSSLKLKNERIYTVKSGDSLWSIAINNHIKVDDLLTLNNLSESKAKKLKPGDKLRIQ
ncbi:MAG: LysM peptidoglycan-binding domain-containing protein [Rhabdochlamydiaceae bacterium]|nr:LysM peptidoglycan-binding domain-containing protein [Candidatus Amphrikana amoebophyrae]